MSHEVVSTRVADRGIAALRGARLKAYQAFEQDLASAGCRAMGYRLTGDYPLPSLCVKHLRGADRVLVAFVQDKAWVLLVGPHNDGDRAADVYARLYELLGFEPPTDVRTKPPCCNDNGEPPELQDVEIDPFNDRG